MVLGFLKSNTPPIAVDFGYSDLKIIQVVPGHPGSLIAAAHATVPEECRADPNLRFDFLAQALPNLIRQSGCRGKLVCSSIPAWQTFVQHMRVKKSSTPDETIAQIRVQLQKYVAGDPENIVVRFVEVGEVFDASQPMTEVICFAVARDVVMRQVQVFKKCRLEIGGFHAEPVAIVKAFEHIHRRTGDDQITTMYVDLGTACTKVMISHGKDLRFTKSVPFGGRFLDQRIAESLKCESEKAHTTRIEAIMHPPVPALAGVGAGEARSMTSDRGATASGSPLTSEPISGPTTTVDRRGGGTPAILNEVGPSEDGTDQEASSKSDPAWRSAIEPCINDLAEELKACIRYHNRLFDGRPLDRMIFVGGESRDTRLCQEIARQIGVVTFRGEPVKKLERTTDQASIPSMQGSGSSGWTVAMGLTNCPIGES